MNQDADVALCCYCFDFSYCMKSNIQSKCFSMILDHVDLE